uniref:Im:7138239 n=1 Tax=Astyanax mexicanus TaxID=7994 RepID=A0A8B9HRZ2_ASTMX
MFWFVLCFVMTLNVLNCVTVCLPVTRNLFAERACCRRQSHFVYIGKGNRARWAPGVIVPPIKGFSCVPTKFDSTLVDTPNKVELIQTVTGCDMKEGCYRIPYIEYHYEITYSEEGLKEEKLKEIDVGRCLGSCTSGNRCLLRSASDSAECLLWAEGQGSACVPQGYKSHTFMNQHGQTRTVLSITSCLCQS